MKLDSLNEQNYWAPLQALADEAGCTLRRGNEHSRAQTTAYFLIDGRKVAYVEPVTTFSSYYQSSVTGYRAHGKYLPRKESRRGGYGDDDSWNFNYVQRKELAAVIKELRPFLRNETPLETFNREHFAARDRLLVDIPRYRLSGPQMDRDMAQKVLVAMYRDGMINDDRARLARVGTEYAGDGKYIPVLLEEVLCVESRRIDDEISNEIIMELFRGAHAAGLKLAGLKED